MIPESFYWTTTKEHRDNMHTMVEYLDEHLSNDFEVIEHDGTYAEIRNKKTGNNYGVHASGNGDFFNHKVEFEALI